MASNATVSITELESSPAPMETDGQTSPIRWAIWVFSGLVLFGLSMLALNLTPNPGQSGYGTDTVGELNIGQETLRIADDLQCPVCEGQSVAYSNSQLASEMRRQVEEKLLAGEDEAAIKQFFIDRYGVRVLREPPRIGLNLWLWRLPVLGLIIGLVGLTWSLRHVVPNRHAIREDLSASSDSATDEDDPLDPEIKELLAQYDRDLFKS